MFEKQDKSHRGGISKYYYIDGGKYTIEQIMELKSTDRVKYDYLIKRITDIIKATTGVI